jgi:hypothetical protein
VEAPTPYYAEPPRWHPAPWQMTPRKVN